MKKFLTLLTLLCVSALSMSARDRVYRDAKALPAQAQETLRKAFPKSEVNRVKVDENMFGYRDYEVVLADGVEIEFDKDGDWTEVDCGHRAVPELFVIAPIRQFVKANHGKAVVVKVDKDRKSYDLELSDGTELKFDRAGKFLRYDD